MLNTILIEQGLERWEIIESEIYPRPLNAIDAEIIVQDNTVTIKPKDKLQENCRYLVVMSPELCATDGSSMDLQVFYFDSMFSPLYTSYFNVINEISAVSSAFTPHMVYTAIKNVSLYIENLITVEKPIPYAVQQYTKYAAAYKLLNQLVLQKDYLSGQEFQLDDLRVKYNTNNLLKERLDVVRQEMAEWKRRLGLTKTRNVVKGGSINSQPINSRLI